MLQQPVGADERYVHLLPSTVLDRQQGQTETLGKIESGSFGFSVTKDAVGHPRERAVAAVPNLKAVVQFFFRCSRFPHLRLLQSNDRADDAEIRSNYVTCRIPVTDLEAFFASTSIVGIVEGSISKFCSCPGPIVHNFEFTHKSCFLLILHGSNFHDSTNVLYCLRPNEASPLRSTEYSHPDTQST